MSQNVKNLEELKVSKFEFNSIKLKKFTPEEQKNIIFREIIEDEIVKEVRLSSSLSFGRIKA